MLAINTLLVGGATLSFSQGPYSSAGQEIWYRYGSLGLFLIGAIIPAFALLLGARRSSLATAFLIMWMLAALFTFLVYAFYSGGGM